MTTRTPTATPASRTTLCPAFATESPPSLLVIGLFHSSFNATEAVLRSSHDWVRVAIVVAVGVFLAAASYRGEP